MEVAPTVNTAQAGRGIPLRWQCSSNGTPVSEPARVKLAQRLYACDPINSAASDEIEAYATGESGLRYEGDGYWHFNWQTPKTYAGACADLRLDVDGSQQLEAKFRFRK